MLERIEQRSSYADENNTTVVILCSLSSVILNTRQKLRLSRNLTVVLSPRKISQRQSLEKKIVRVRLTLTTSANFTFAVLAKMLKFAE